MDIFISTIAIVAFALVFYVLEQNAKLKKRMEELENKINNI